MVKWCLVLRHDGGLFRVSTVARSREAAISMVCRAEGCPVRAVVSCEEV